MKILSITGFDLFNKLYEGETSFSNLCIENHYTMNTLQDYPSLIERLKRADFLTNPVRFTDFRAEGLSIANIVLPYSLFTGCEFNGSIFIESDLSNATFSNCRFSGCSFAKSNLSESFFVNCEFAQCNFEEINGLGANFMKSRIRSTIFVKAQLQESIFSDALLSEVDFTKANLSSANLERASVAGVNFFRAHLKKTNLKNLRALDEALNLEFAVYLNTRVGEKEQLLLLSTMKKRFFSVE